MRKDAATTISGEHQRIVDGTDGVMRADRVLICDRDPKWSDAVVAFFERKGIRVIRTPPRAPNCNAYAERVRAVNQKRSAWTASSCSASATCDAPLRSSSPTITRNAVIKVSMGGMLNYYYRAERATQFSDSTRPESTEVVEDILVSPKGIVLETTSGKRVDERLLTCGTKPMRAKRELVSPEGIEL